MKVRQPFNAILKSDVFKGEDVDDVAATDERLDRNLRASRALATLTSDWATESTRTRRQEQEDASSLERRRKEAEADVDVVVVTATVVVTGVVATEGAAVDIESIVFKMVEAE